MIKKTLIKHLLICSLAIPFNLGASSGLAGDIGINLHFGTPYYPPVVVAPRPVYRHPAPVFYFDATPDFCYMDSLGFYAAMGSPYDLFRYRNSYYIFHDGYWHRSSRLNGPWVLVDYRSLPHGFRKHKIDKIRRYRDAEYDRHRYDRRGYPSRRDHHPHDRNRWDNDDRDYRGRH